MNSRRGGLIKAVVSKDHATIIECLQATDMAAAMTDNLGWTAVHHAAYNGDDEILQLLLNYYSPSIRKELVNRTTFNGRTPLLLACDSDVKLSNSVVQILIMNGCNVNYTSYGDSAVNLICCRQGRSKEALSTLRTLRDMGCSFGKIPRVPSPLRVALYYGMEDEIVKFLMETLRWTTELLDEALIEDFLGLQPISPYLLLTLINLDYPGFYRDRTIVTISADKILLRGINTSKFDHRFVLLMFLNTQCYSCHREVMEKMKLILQEGSIRGLSITIPHAFVRLSDYGPGSPGPSQGSDLAPNHPESAYKRREMMVGTRHEKILFGLFPEKRATRSLQAMCRVATRAWLVDRHSSALEAYDWLVQCSLPTAIKQYLLYETECPSLVESPRNLMERMDAREI